MHNDSYRMNNLTTLVIIARQKPAHLGWSDVLPRQGLSVLQQKLRLCLSDSFLTLKRSFLYQKNTNNFRRARWLKRRGFVGPNGTDNIKEAGIT